jgi:hypothetical protein
VDAVAAGLGADIDHGVAGAGALAVKMRSARAMPTVMALTSGLPS